MEGKPLKPAKRKEPGKVIDPAPEEHVTTVSLTTIAETEARVAAVEEKIAASASDPDRKASRPPRKARALPESLPRVERVIEPATIVCPCGCGDMVRIGEDRHQRLDLVRARSQVVVTVLPRCSMRPKSRLSSTLTPASGAMLKPVSTV